MTKLFAILALAIRFALHTGRQRGGGGNTPGGPSGPGRQPSQQHGNVNAGNGIISAISTTRQTGTLGRPPSAGGQQTGPSNAQLQSDLDPNPRPGETPQQAADRVDAAQNELALRQAMDTYNGLGEDPPRVNIAENDAAHRSDGAHTGERHGPDVPLNRGPGRTVEGRIYGDPPWGPPQNYSYRWDNHTTMNQTVNDYIQANWDTIRSDLATDGRHRGIHDAGHRIGEGFYNDGSYGTGPRNAHYGTTSHMAVRIEMIPGSNPPKFFVVSAFPSGSGTP